MAFAKTLAGQFPTLGSPNFAGPPAVTLATGGNTGAFAQAIGVAINATTTNTTFNTFPGPGFISRGWVRIKTSSVNAATTSITYSIKGTDGTTTVFFTPTSGNLLVAGAGANQAVDVMLPFMTDLNLTSLTVVITTATNTATFDIEVALNV